MKITLKEEEIELKYGFKSLIIFENITKKPFNPSTLEDMIIFFYSVTLASKKEYNITFDEFIEWLDEEPSRLTEFSEWLSKIYGVNEKISPVDKEKATTKKKKKTS